jgi:hypothetical protein
MSDHSITWDHTYCDHTVDAGGDVIDCSPRGTITCHAVGEGEVQCHLMEVTIDGGFCESWSECDWASNDQGHAMCPDFEHHNLGRHCTYGHPLRVVDYCNALVWIDNQSVEDSCVGGWPSEFKDGPVDIEWDGDTYVWSYA